MKNYFHIKDGTIVNVVVQDKKFVAPYNPNSGEIWIEDDGIHGIGDIYDAETKTFSKPSVKTS